MDLFRAQITFRHNIIVQLIEAPHVLGDQLFEYLSQKFVVSGQRQNVPLTTMFNIFCTIIQGRQLVLFDVILSHVAPKSDPMSRIFTLVVPT